MEHKIRSFAAQDQRFWGAHGLVLRRFRCNSSALLRHSGAPFEASSDSFRRLLIPVSMPFQGTKASNKHLKSTVKKSDIFHPGHVRRDNEQLTLRLLTSRRTGDTLRPMDVLHERGQHSAVPLLDSANNCDRDNAERVPFRAFVFSGRTNPN